MSDADAVLQYGLWLGWLKGISFTLCFLMLMDLLGLKRSKRGWTSSNSPEK